MAHYAILNTSMTVSNVITGRDENETVDGITDWESHYSEVTGSRVVRTSYNTYGGIHYDAETGQPSTDQSKAFRKNYAVIGHSYDPDRDAFIAPKPYGSWVLNETTCLWEAPVPMPEGGDYTWNESTVSWEPVSEV